MPTRILRVLGHAAPALLVLYAALLRFDALVTKFGLIAGSPQVEAAERHVQALADRLRPAALQWKFVGERRGDPVSYLKIARAEHGFYEASAREPLFLDTIRVFLWLTGDQDIAVSCASGLYSTLLVLATVLIGSLASSRAVGLGAGSLLAIDAWLIAYGVDGWRDDAFAFFVVMTTYGLLRLRRAPSFANASIAGVCAAAACLVRLTSLSFIVPALALVAIDGARGALRRRTVYAGIALGVTIALVAPFMVNNWIVFGDPFYSFDFATEFYRGRGSLPVEEPMAWGGVFAARLAAHPLATVDSLLYGLTAYPFGNKWEGLAYLTPLPAVLRIATIFGLLILPISAAGRLLLVVLFTALLPFAAIWHTPTGSQWRFTIFAYPFYFVAAGHALRAALRLCSRGVRGRLGKSLRREPLRWTIGALAVVGGIAIAPFVPRWWQYLLAREAAAVDGVFSIEAGRGDASFFGDGWNAPVQAGNVTGRYSRGARATLFVPFFERADTRLTFRMQACSDEAREVRVSINGTEISTLHVVWNPLRAGSYDVAVPQALVQEGWNTIELEADRSTVVAAGETRFLGLEAGQESAFFLWHVQVAPARGG